VDLIDLTINDDYKQKQITGLKKDVKELKEENKNLKNEVDELKKDNNILKEDNKQKDIKINKLEKDIKVLIDDKQKFNALVKLHECNALVNNEFKKLYRIKFNKKKTCKNFLNINR
jgi:chromosome segregation ATPase